MSIGVLPEEMVWIMKEAPTRGKIVLGMNTRKTTSPCHLPHCLACAILHLTADDEL